MLYPLHFEPLFQQYLWGGRNLAKVLGKPIGLDENYAESWEVVDHPDGQSIVANGPLAGRTLHELVQESAEPLFGTSKATPRFPLLFKFLDCNRNLSVQVHPDDEAAARLQPPDLGKTEAWVILDAKPGSALYAGLKSGIDRESLQSAIKNGDTEVCLHRVEPKVGDCIFIPAGTVHALGEGLVVAEIQQASNTTYRLFDWNRVDQDGKPRPLHIEAALDVIDYQRGPVNPQVGVEKRDGVSELVRCSKFVLERWDFDGVRRLSDDGRFHLLAMLSGSVRVDSESIPGALVTGQTMLVPACCSGLKLESTGPASLLHVVLPS